jgi:hypothetical protein
LKTIVEKVKVCGGMVAIVFVLGLGIGSSKSMPPYARVYIDDDTKTYLALPCLDEWQHRKGDSLAFLRLSSAAEAHKLKYKPDDNCRETGAFSEDDRSLSGIMLQDLGILQPIEHWWDKPYRDEQGKIVQPRIETH